MKFLKESGIKKVKGYGLMEIITFLITLIFSQKSFYAFLNSQNKGEKNLGKDAIYTFLGNWLFDWRGFLLKLGGSVVEFLQTLTRDNRTNVLIVDDSLYSRSRSKKVELLARVFDHCTGLYHKGFRMLTFGWSDGASFIPLGFSLLSSAKAKNRLYESGPEVPENCPGYFRRQEAILPATRVFLQMLDQVLQHVTCFQYVLFDSWFGVGPLILGVKQRQRDVICMLKDAPNVYYGYDGKAYKLRELFAAVPKRKAKNGPVASVVVYYYGVQVRIVFVRNQKAKREWLALLSTDTNISDEEIIRIYGLRWDIEVFFKMCKSFLKLAKEVQGRSYDSMFAHTTIVFMRYILLSIENRESKDSRALGGLFYACCDEVQEISFNQAFLLIMNLLTKTLRDVALLPEEAINRVVEQFIADLPYSVASGLFRQAA